ncbi:MAG: FmdB family zinc ribbon protein [Promethearchaeota archaeon]
MPTYHYRCSSCGHQFNKYSSISSYKKELECPICHNVAKLTISGGSGVIFKGPGFYVNDYKKNSSKTSGKSKKKKSV